MAVSVAQHYSRGSLGHEIRSALLDAGKDLERLHPDDLAPYDQFHTRGREATLELGKLAGLRPDERVLDLGGGLGGPARLLALAYGCRVTVLDVTEMFILVGEDLTRRCRLDHRVQFRHGNALATPFESGAFDVVWTQHASMNIPDKAALYREARRVLRPGGRLAIHEIMGGPQPGPLTFPVPWAREPGLSHVVPAPRLRALIGGLGFQEEIWRDLTSESAAWLRERVGALGRGPLPAAARLFLGDLAAPALLNYLEAVEAGRLVVVQAVWRKTA